MRNYRTYNSYYLGCVFLIAWICLGCSRVEPIDKSPPPTELASEIRALRDEVRKLRSQIEIEGDWQVVTAAHGKIFFFDAGSLYLFEGARRSDSDEVTFKQVDTSAVEANNNKDKPGTLHRWRIAVAQDGTLYLYDTYGPWLFLAARTRVTNGLMMKRLDTLAPLANALLSDASALSPPVSKPTNAGVAPAAKNP